MIPTTTKTKIKLIHTKFVVKRKNYTIYIYISSATSQNGWRFLPTPLTLDRNPTKSIGAAFITFFTPHVIMFLKLKQTSSSSFRFFPFLCALFIMVLILVIAAQSLMMEATLLVIRHQEHKSIRHQEHKSILTITITPVNKIFELPSLWIRPCIAALLAAPWRPLLLLWRPHTVRSKL